MARRRFGAGPSGALKRARPALRLAGRLTGAGVILSVAALVTVQFVEIVGENVATARRLAALRADIATLTRRRDEQQRELQRLHDPQGAVPEIHDRLRLVGPKEAIIFVSPVPSSAP